MDPFLISGDSTLFQHFIDKIALALKGLEEHTSLKCLKKIDFFEKMCMEEKHFLRILKLTEKNNYYI